MYLNGSFYVSKPCRSKRSKFEGKRRAISFMIFQICVTTYDDEETFETARKKVSDIIECQARVEIFKTTVCKDGLLPYR